MAQKKQLFGCPAQFFFGGGQGVGAGGQILFLFYFFESKSQLHT